MNHPNPDFGSHKLDVAVDAAKAALAECGPQQEFSEAFDAIAPKLTKAASGEPTREVPFPEIQVTSGAPAGCTADAMAQSGKWVYGPPAKEFDARAIADKYPFDQRTDARTKFIMELERAYAAGAASGAQPAQAALEHDRTKVAECLTAVKSELHSYDWLITSRGSYEWNDDTWHDEFRRASEAIWKAIEPMVKIAADWSNCPQNWEDVQAARLAAPAVGLSEEQVKRIVKLHHNPIAQVFLWSAMTADLNDALHQPVSAASAVQPAEGEK